MSQSGKKKQQKNIPLERESPAWNTAHRFYVEMSLGKKLRWSTKTNWGIGEYVTPSVGLDNFEHLKSKVFLKDSDYLSAVWASKQC